MIFIAAVALGIVAYNTLPVSLMPDIPIPEVTVNISYPNSSARELENVIVKPVRTQLLQVAHLNSIKSETQDGKAVIFLRFDYGTNIDYAFIEVNEKIDASMNVLPRSLERPRVIKASTTDIPVYYLNLTLKDKKTANGYINDEFIQLSRFSESVIRKRIEQLPEVALVDISGTVYPQLTISPDLQKMASLNYTINQLEDDLNQNNIDAGSMIIRDGYYQYSVRFSTLLRTTEDVENIYLKIPSKIVRLKDIAKVVIESQDYSGMFLSNGKPAITMAIIKQADARIGDMKEQIQELVGRFESDYPEIDFEVSRDQTELLDYSINNLKQNLGQGLLLVILVVFVFLKDLKLPVLIGFSLVVSVIISLLFFKLMNLSINIISLAGLILAVGNMMDNSIVVTDNISQYRERNFVIDDACIAGTNDVIIPQLSSMLVNIAVFLPLIFLSGIAGALMYDEAVAVSIGLSVSYIVGITFMPVIYRLSYKKVTSTNAKIRKLKISLFGAAKGKTKKLFDSQKFYGAFLNFTFRHKKLNIIMYLLIIPVGIFVLIKIPKEKMPFITQTEIIISVDWNESIDADENRRRTERMVALVNDETVQINSYIGKQQFLLSHIKDMGVSEAQIYIKAKSPDALERIKDKIKKHFDDEYMDASLQIEPPTTIFERLFTSSEPPLVANISTKLQNTEPDLPKLIRFCQDINGDSILNSVNNIPIQDHIVINADFEKMMLYNVSYDKLVDKLKTDFKENFAGTLRSFQEYIPIVIYGDNLTIDEIIGKNFVVNNNNQPIPLSSILSISVGQDLKKIIAGKDGEYVPFVFSPTRDEHDNFIDQITKKVRSSGIFDVTYTGSISSNIKLLKEVGLLLAISVLLLYLILAAQFESLTQPLLVLLEIPIDIAGALIVLFIAGQSLNIMSALGMVIMCGIIITDSILKLDVINKLRKEGYSLSEAISIGGHRRLRAIIMTSLTSLLAMLPLLFTNDLGSELQQPFSYALIGGMITGTFVSLFLVPLVYWFMYRKTEIPSID
jgi:multidrug efflux pump subunit AcrB